MTPRDKSKELLSKLFPYTEGWVDRKAIANIIVDEIKEVVKELCDEETIGIHMIYWEKVKNEINNL